MSDSGTRLQGVAIPANTAPLAAPEQDPLIGSTVGTFRIVRKLGRGGMGTVYLGEHLVIGSKVAVKVLHEHLSSSTSLVQRFYAEARAVNLIGHENIVSIFDLTLVPPARYCLIMEYLEGHSLAALARGPLEPRIAIPILAQVCDALQAAHAQGVAHRDLKPENIFLIRRARADHFVKILDFGIAKLFSTEAGPDEAPTTSAGVIVGTPEYMSPEQCSGEPVDGRTDLYALGIISYLLSTGRLPFSGGGLAPMLVAHREKIPPAPHTLVPSLPRAWSDLTMRALEKRPEDRFPDAKAMREALDEALRASEGAAATRMATPHPMFHSDHGGPMLTPVVPSPPPVPPTPAPRAPVLAASVTTASGQSLGILRCADVSRGGLFLCLDGALPVVGARLKLTLQFPDLPLPVSAEVVRHVTPEQAEGWKMSPGVAVQFLEPSPALKDALARHMKGLPQATVTPATTATPVRDTPDDRIAKPVLEAFQRRLGASDPYVLLNLPSDADGGEIRQRSREQLRELEALRRRPLSPAQEAQVSTTLQRVQQAQDLLGNLMRRIEFDAGRGNFKGVARAIAGGLTVTELELQRERFLATHPSAESRANFHRVTGNAYEARQELRLALEEYEKALTVDPLNLALQQRYWALKRRSVTPPPART